MSLLFLPKQLYLAIVVCSCGSKHTHLVGEDSGRRLRGDESRLSYEPSFCAEVQTCFLNCCSQLLPVEICM